MKPLGLLELLGYSSATSRRPSASVAWPQRKFVRQATLGALFFYDHYFHPRRIIYRQG
jgi:hypothetical protein